MIMTPAAESADPSAISRAVPLEGRLRWHSRRALLELDIVLERFWQRQTAPLSTEQALVLEELLALEDHDLWDMMCGRLIVDDARWQQMIDLLLKV